MPKAHETEWVAHVYYPDKSVKEITVSALAGHKFSALTKVYNAVEVTGPNDPKILGVKIQETGKTKAYKAGKRLKTEVAKDAENADLGDFHRFRVSLYPTEDSVATRVQVLRAINPFEALTSVMKLAGQDDVSKTGPYMVERATANGWELKMAKKASAFGANYIPPVPHGPAPAARASKPQHQPKKEALVSSVAELFRLEKKVSSKRYTVKQG